MVRFLRSVSMLMLLPVLGCGGGGGTAPPATIPVSGTVMYKGAPVEGATVTFYHDKAPRGASGVTDKEGKYSLTMFEPNDGAVAGENIITVTKGSAPAAAPVSSGGPPSPEDLAKKMAEMKSGDSRKKKDGGELPAKYATQATTPLKETVSEQNNKIPLQLAD